jgi:hypothetical protein
VVPTQTAAGESTLAARFGFKRAAKITRKGAGPMRHSGCERVVLPAPGNPHTRYEQSSLLRGEPWEAPVPQGTGSSNDTE